MKVLKEYSIDELNNMSLAELKNTEDEVYAYYNKVMAVRKFTEQCEKEE